MKQLLKFVGATFGGPGPWSTESTEPVIPAATLLLPPLLPDMMFAMCTSVDGTSNADTTVLVATVSILAHSSEPKA